MRPLSKPIRKPDKPRNQGGTLKILIRLLFGYDKVAMSALVAALFCHTAAKLKGFRDYVGLGVRRVYSDFDRGGPKP